MMKQVRLCTVWPTENWIASSLNHIQGWMTVPKILLSLSSYWVFGVTMTRCFFQSLITEKKSNEERVSRPGQGTNHDFNSLITWICGNELHLSH